MPDRLKITALLTMLSIVICFTGCLSSGSQTSSPVTPESPEKEVARILQSWQQNPPVFSVSEKGSLLASEETSGNFIRFKDLSGELWTLKISDILYVNTGVAKVTTFYYSVNADQGSLKIVFTMIKDQGFWYVDNISVETLPVVVVSGTGIKGIISDSVSNAPVQGALVEAYEQSSNTFAGSSVTGSDGFYSINDLSPGTYYLVVARDGYTPYTISGIVVN